MNSVILAKDIMKTEVLTINPWKSLAIAAQLMNKHAVGSLPVVENDKLVGIITSRDIRSAHPNRLVADAMTKNLITITPDTLLWEIKQLLERHRIERLPVVEETNTLIGLVNKAVVYSYSGVFKDSLTGLPKTSYIYQIIGDICKIAADISILFIDIDKFGEIDKVFGHTIGDLILQEVAQTLQSLKPAEGHLCRYGGDEFALVLPWTQEKAKNFAVTVANAINETTFSKNIKITISIGIAGGQRQTLVRESNFSSMLTNLFNMASLASTKAKKKTQRVVVAKELITI